MNPADRYLRELDDALVVRGRPRQRLLRECRDHLVDASAVHGPDEAVRRFGPATELAASFDLETATRRAGRATVAVVAGVVAVGLSTLALIHSADPGRAAVPVWTVLFFGFAQASAVAAALAGGQVLAMRREAPSAAELALLGRRGATALGCAAVTLCAAAGAMPGHGSALPILAGPVVAAVAAGVVLRARSLVRRLAPRRSRVVRSPVADLAAVLRRPAPDVGPVRLLIPVAVLATAAAYWWNLGDGGTVSNSFVVAATELGLVLVGFVAGGPALGLRAPWLARARTR